MESNAPFQRKTIFGELVFCDDTEPRSAELQMAVDEVLLGMADLPVLRVYRWESPCVTIGYFESHAAATAAHPGLPVVRRWTGGGLVVHGTDAPYSLLVPAHEPFAMVRPVAAYRAIHRALAEALRGRLPEVTLATTDAPKQSAACFDNPVAADLLCGNSKVGGAGQRRTRLGLLHQGSLQLGGDTFSEASVFARTLALCVREESLSREILALTEGVAQTRYGRPEWNHDRQRR
jgi:lipoate-protein ligase A